MATVQRKVVHKQFNSPIALYSDGNIKDTLDRELKSLGNGAVGINFADPATTRPGSLAKSAVLAALEEEENGARQGMKRVAWPPALESSSYTEPVDYQQKQQPQWQPISQQQSQPVQQQVPSAPAVIPPTIQSAPAPQYQQPPKLQAPLLSKIPQRPVSIHGFSSLQNQFEAPQKPLSPLPMLQTNFPQYSPPNQAPPPQAVPFGSPRGWAHVNAPRSPGGSFNQPKQFYAAGAQPLSPPFELPSAPAYTQANVAQQISPPQPQYQQQQQYQQPPFQGTPLRKEAPITQKPAPVYQSQPVATSFQGGANKRGDQKWPPSNYKEQVEIDNEARRRIALGPAFRPKRANRDYREFFAQNALSNTYPGYRVPPGTLHVGYGEFL